MLTPNPDEAVIVRRIFEDVVEFGSLARVCDDLTAAGLTTKSRTIGTRDGDLRHVGGRRFRPDTIKSVIQNPIYLGPIRRQAAGSPEAEG